VIQERAACWMHYLPTGLHSKTTKLPSTALSLQERHMQPS